MPDELTVGRVLLAEYESLKHEQHARIVFRDRLPYATLASLAGTIAVTAGGSGRGGLLLVLPATCIVLGWIYLVNDEKVSSLGRYLRDELAPQIALLVDNDRVLGWEVAHRSDRHRASRKRLQLSVELGTFVLPAIASVVAYWLIGPYSVLFGAVSVIEVLTAIVLAAQIVLYADLTLTFSTLWFRC